MDLTAELEMYQLYLLESFWFYQTNDKTQT